MYAVIDTNGAVVACGETGSFAPPEGGRIIQVSANPLEGLAADTVAVWDGAAFVAQPRTISADETDYRDIRDRLRYALDNWASLTAAQKDALLKVCVRGLLRSLR